MSDYLRPYYEQGLDAVIVQDIGAMRLIREAFPRSAASCKYSGNCDTNTERTTFSENGSRENCAGKRVVSGRN